MSEDWEKLVAAILKKEQLRQLLHSDSVIPSIASDSSHRIASLDDVPLALPQHDVAGKSIQSIIVEEPIKKFASKPATNRNLKIEVPEVRLEDYVGGSSECFRNVSLRTASPRFSPRGGWILNNNNDNKSETKQQSYPLPLPPGAEPKSAPVSPTLWVAKWPSPSSRSPQRISSEDFKSHWKKGKLIGRGPLGNVYLGFNSERGEMCAMKEVRLSHVDMKRGASILEREIVLLSCMKHRNIVQYLGSEVVGDNFYIYLEYLSGGTIHAILQEYGKLGESAIRNYTKQILTGLAYLHSEHIVHGNIKAASMLVDPSGTVKLSNFFIEKRIAGLSHPSFLLDIPYWTAPEVIMNSNVRTSASDIWSLGCTVLEMATSKPPLSLLNGTLFPRQQVMAMFNVSCLNEIPKIPDHLSEVCKDFLRCCLQLNPLHRATASQLLEHPFVKSSSPLEKQKLVSCPLNHSVVTNSVSEAEALESYIEEMDRAKENEELLLRLRQETETMKNQHDQILQEIQLIQAQKPALERQLNEAHCSEREREEKIVQAVNLLITFKGTRDGLQREYDSAVRKCNKYKALQREDPSVISPPHFFGISFSDIIEGTENFKPSHKIGEGRYGSVFKGILSHNKVAIKMLPSSGSQSDSEFKIEVEVLSRVRHPNLVTLLGACPESRSLVYEYIDNGSLEDFLSKPAKTSCLPWQTRIRIATDICSALMFLHANSGCNVHGNLKPSNILLDAHFVTKISEFGIFNLVAHDKNNLHANNPEYLEYIDPESLETGELTTDSDVYSFGMVLLRLLTARPATGALRDVKCALEKGKLDSVLDISAGDWPLKQAKKLASLALKCCEDDSMDRPDLVSQIWPVLEPMRELCSTSSSTDSGSQRKIPSHFLCPIFQDVMKDPHIAGDGYTYEADAIQGWFNSGHETSPMTNLKLENCDLIPNYALYYAIQEWQQNA